LRHLEELPLPKLLESSIAAFAVQSFPETALPTLEIGSYSILLSVALKLLPNGKAELPGGFAEPPSLED